MRNHVRLAIQAGGLWLHDQPNVLTALQCDVLQRSGTAVNPRAMRFAAAAFVEP